jgi:uncharacterized membrane protein YgcG
MGGSAIPNIDQAMLAKLSGDSKVVDLAKKYGYTIPKTLPAQATPAQAGWQFPQYSQTWAFTPPAPTPLMLPPPFGSTDKKSGDSDGSSGGSGGSRGGTGGLSVRPLTRWDVAGRGG